MKESKRQRRNRMLDQKPTQPLKPVDRTEHWPVGPLPDESINSDTSEGSVEDPVEKPTDQKSEDGFDEWTVSWP